MSLRAFHVLFVVASILLSIGFGVWCLNSPLARGNQLYLAIGILSFVISVGLMIYAVKFLRKVKRFDSE